VFLASWDLDFYLGDISWLGRLVWNCLMVFPHWVDQLLVAVIKYLRETNLEKERSILAHSFKIFSPQSPALVPLGLGEEKHHDQGHVVKQSSSPYFRHKRGWQREGEREGERKGWRERERDPLLSTRSHLQISHSVMNSSVINPLMRLVPSWFSHPSIVPPGGNQAFNTWLFGDISCPNHKNH
jgi:hypothetical protein